MACKLLHYYDVQYDLGKMFTNLDPPKAKLTLRPAEK